MLREVSGGITSLGSFGAGLGKFVCTAEAYVFPVVASILTHLSSSSELDRVDFMPGKAVNLSVHFAFVVCLYSPLLRLLYIFCSRGFTGSNNLFSCSLSGGFFDCFIFTTGGSAYVSSPFSLFCLCSQGGRGVIVSLLKGVSFK